MAKMPPGGKDDSRPRVVMERLVKLEELDRSFDLEYWRRMGPEARLVAMWSLVEESLRMQGKDVAPRLQRSVERIQRRPG
jgi:hypothetical protein